MTTTNMRTLGRLGEPLRSTPGFRRRRRVGRPVATGVVLTVALVVWLGVTAQRQLPSPPTPTGVSAPARPALDAASRGAQPQGTGTFAVVDGVHLQLPHHQPVAVGFHEGSRAEALPLQPVGRLRSDANPDAWTRVPDAAGPDYHVLPPQQSGRPATSAVDVVLPAGSTVLSPVDGVVSAVVEYPLMGQTRDWRVVITPEGRPDLAVVAVFVAGPLVAAGDEVTAGETPLGNPRVLPFTTPVDGLVDAGLPRVSFQVEPATATGGIDPNQPAVTPASG